MIKKLSITAFIVFGMCAAAFAQEKQAVEGFDKVEFHYDANRSRPQTDFKGNAKGYMTAGWWSKDQLKENKLSWKTAAVPEKKPTTFSFIASSSVLPAEISLGPKVRLSVNGKYAISFYLGRTHDVAWKEGEYELKYNARRTEFAFNSSHRQFGIDGNSGIYELSVPASAVTAGQPVTLQVEIMPFDRWKNGWFMVKDYRDVLKAPTTSTLQAQVDALRRDVTVLSEQTTILAAKLYADMLGGDKFEHHIAYTDGYRHLHPADLIRLKNGDMLMFAREGTEHYANDGDVLMLRSKDDGKTWGEKQYIGAIPDVDEREGCGIQLKDGTIIVGVFYNDLYKPDGIYNWDNKVKLPDLDRPRLGAHWVNSKDNGKTWSQPKFMDLKGMPFKGIEGPTDAPIELPDGSIVMGVIAYGLEGDVDMGSVLLRSTDKGNTWKYVSTMAADKKKEKGGFVEPGIVRTRTGRIIAAMRNHLSENAIYVTYSDDEGKTWVPVFRTDMVGHPVDLIQLADGRIMATYGIRTGTGRHSEPGGIRACFSSDNGKTWDVKTEVQLRSDFINWDVGYPESIQLKDGRVMTAYYFNLFGKYYLGTTFWKP
jgi:hypothetical protein